MFVTVLKVSLKLRCRRFGFSWALSPWLAHGSLLTVPLRGFFSVLVSPFSSYVNTSHIGLNPTLVTSFNRYYLFKSLVSKYSHILRYRGLEFQFMNFRIQIHSITPWILIFHLIASFCLKDCVLSYPMKNQKFYFIYSVWHFCLSL